MPEIAEGSLHLENRPPVRTEFIPVGKDNVRVSYVKFNNENSAELLSKDEAVIFFMGFPWQAESSSIWIHPQDLAKQFRVSSYNIETDLNRIDPNGLTIEAEAARQFIEKQGLKKVTLVGHSEGGIRAASLAALLEQKDPQIQINGVVLMNSMGMYPQSKATLLKNFAVEVLKIEGQEKNPAVKESIARVMVDFLRSFGKDIKNARLVKYPWLIKNQLAIMTRLNENLTAIKAPVVIMSTQSDFVSDYRKYLPQEEIDQRMREVKSDEQLRQEIEESQKWENLPEEARQQYSSREAFIEDYIAKFRSREEKARIGQARKQYIREKLLPNAQNLEVIIAEKYGSHIGLPAQRSPQTAHVLSRIFDRLRRTDSNSPDQKAA